MVDAATDADLTFNAGTNTLAVPNIAVVGFSSDGSNYGSSGFVPVANGAGQWTWTSLQGASSVNTCLLYTSPSPRDRQKSRMPSSA